MITTKKKHNPFTVASKLVKKSIAISFGRSANDFCAKSCRVYGACYATRIERMYTDLEKKMLNHYMHGPVWVLNKALAQLPNRFIPWARLSVDGALPAKSDMEPKRWKVYVRKLRELVAKCSARGAKWHIPVETMGKARTYRKELRGLGVVVRRSSQARTVKKLLSENDTRSWIAATEIHKGCVNNSEKARNVELAQSVATEARKHNISAVVCPAITSDSQCGKCTACSNESVQLVVYPFHP